MDESRVGGKRRHRPTRVWRLFFLHPVRLINDLLAEHASPRNLALAGAFGAFAGTLPILGLHTVLVYYGAQRMKLNRLLALATNQLGIPPVVPALCIEVGYYLRHHEWLTEISMRTLGREAPLRIWEWLLGALVVGPALAIVVGGAIWLLAVIVQRRPPARGLGVHRADRESEERGGSRA
jgi:uncharacterized protein (DUF2062 family)